MFQCRCILSSIFFFFFFPLLLLRIFCCLFLYVIFFILFILCILPVSGFARWASREVSGVGCETSSVIVSCFCPVFGWIKESWPSWFSPREYWESCSSIGKYFFQSLVFLKNVFCHQQMQELAETSKLLRWNHLDNLRSIYSLFIYDCQLLSISGSNIVKKIIKTSCIIKFFKISWYTWLRWNRPSERSNCSIVISLNLCSCFLHGQKIQDA